MSKDSRVRDLTGPYALFTTPALMFITNQVEGPSFLEGIFASKKRFSIMEILPLMFLYGYDDFATARGFQAKPPSGYEENPIYSGFAIWAMEKGFAKTETAAIRLLGFYNQLLNKQWKNRQMKSHVQVKVIQGAGSNRIRQPSAQF